MREGDLKELFGSLMGSSGLVLKPSVIIVKVMFGKGLEHFESEMMEKCHAKLFSHVRKREKESFKKSEKG